MATKTRLEKHQTPVFIDASETYNTATWTPDWKRVELSTTFALNPNPQTETMDFIAYENPVEEITKYQPELPLECATYEGDPAFDFVYKMFKKRPVGAEAYVPTLICFAGSDKDAWQIQQTTMVLGEFNSVDRKISFTQKFGGDIEDGTYTITDGKPTFTATK
jgi:hypothetical protein